MKGYFGILTIGGTTLTLALVCKRSKQVRAKSIVPFSGILNGEFVDRQELPRIVAELIVETDAFSMQAREIFVAVPDVFVTVKTKEIISEFGFKKKVGIDSLLKADDFHESLEGYILHSHDLYHLIDDETAASSVIGKQARKVATMHSVILGCPHFAQALHESLSIQFTDIKFVPQALCDALYLLNQDIRDQTCTLVHFSMFDTTVIVVCGDGVLHIDTVPIGYAHVLNDLCIVKEICHDTAKTLIGHVCLSLNHEPGDMFEIKVENELKKFQKMEVCNIVKCRVEELAEELQVSIKSFDEKLFNRPVHIYGGYADSIKGTKLLLSKIFGAVADSALCPQSGMPACEDMALPAVKSFVV